MFGKDDNQKPASSDFTAPAPPDSFNGVSDPSFNPPAGPATAPLASDTDTPELPSSGTPDAAPASDSPAPSTDGIVATNSNDDGLLDLKQQALQQLSPLVGHLDQTPEEKFRTTMMMIQASDNHGLIKDAFEAAQKINDDKARAQALLDVINEINYFTQHQDQA